MKLEPQSIDGLRVRKKHIYDPSILVSNFVVNGFETPR